MIIFKSIILLLFLSFSYSNQQTLTSKPRIQKNQKITIGFKYHSYNELTKLLKLVAKRFPHLTDLYSIGKSVEGRELWVLHITDNNSSNVPVKPNVKYVANMHGNEAVGRELMLHLVAHLVNNANRSHNVKNLLKYTNIHILPSMNPDGFEKSTEGNCDGPGRRNSANYDLNRNFPDRIYNNTRKEQPETKAIREWISKTQFVLSANLHGGAIVVNYPFDSGLSDNNKIEKTPDHDVFHNLARAYAKRHPKMQPKSQCENDQSFENGITNGNAWYPVKGSMQDYNYIYGGCMEVTLELSCCKHPVSSDLHKFWSENKIALLSFLTEAQKGVKGVVRDSRTETPIQKANLTILGRDVIFRTDDMGQFWRILLPGDYVLLVEAKGYAKLSKQFTIVENKITIINVYLAPLKPRNSRNLEKFWSNKLKENNDLNHVRSERLTSANGSAWIHHIRPINTICIHFLLLLLIVIRL